MPDTQQPETSPFPLRQTLPEEEAWKNIGLFEGTARTALRHRITVSITPEITKETERVHQKALEILETTKKGSKREKLLRTLIGQVHGTRATMDPKQLRPIIAFLNMERLHPADIAIYTRDKTLLVLGSADKTIDFPKPETLMPSLEEGPLIEEFQLEDLLDQIATLKQLLEAELQKNYQPQETPEKPPEEPKPTTTQSTLDTGQIPTPSSEQLALILDAAKRTRSPKVKDLLNLLLQHESGLESAETRKQLSLTTVQLHRLTRNINKGILAPFKTRIYAGDGYVRLGERPPTHDTPEDQPAPLNSSSITPQEQITDLQLASPTQIEEAKQAVTDNPKVLEFLTKFPYRRKITEKNVQKLLNEIYSPRTNVLAKRLEINKVLEPLGLRITPIPRQPSKQDISANQWEMHSTGIISFKAVPEQVRKYHRQAFEISKTDLAPTLQNLFAALAGHYAGVPANEFPVDTNDPKALAKTMHYANNHRLKNSDFKIHRINNILILGPTEGPIIVSQEIETFELKDIIPQTIPEKLIQILRTLTSENQSLILTEVIQNPGKTDQETLKTRLVTNGENLSKSITSLNQALSLHGLHLNKDGFTLETLGEGEEPAKPLTPTDLYTAQIGIEMIAIERKFQATLTGTLPTPNFQETPEAPTPSLPNRLRALVDEAALELEDLQTTIGQAQSKITDLETALQAEQELTEQAGEKILALTDQAATNKQEIAQLKEQVDQLQSLSTLTEEKIATIKRLEALVTELLSKKEELTETLERAKQDKTKIASATKRAETAEDNVIELQQQLATDREELFSRLQLAAGEITDLEQQLAQATAELKEIKEREMTFTEVASDLKAQISRANTRANTAEAQLAKLKNQPQTLPQAPSSAPQPAPQQPVNQILLKTLTEIILSTIRSPERQQFFSLIADSPEGISTSFVKKALEYNDEKIRIKMAQINNDKLKRYNLKIVRQGDKLIMVTLGENGEEIPISTLTPESPATPEPKPKGPKPGPKGPRLTPEGPPVNTHQDLRERIQTLTGKLLIPGPAGEIKRESIETLLGEVQKINVVGSITPGQLRNYESMVRTLLARKEGTHFEFREVSQIYNLKL